MVVTKVNFALLALALSPAFVAGSQQEESRGRVEQRFFGRRVASELTQLNFHILTTMSKLRMMKKYFPPRVGESLIPAEMEDLEVLRQYEQTLRRLSEMRREVQQLSDRFGKDWDGKKPSASVSNLSELSQALGTELQGQSGDD